ncbi:WS/DGAT domain-containing protein [Nocardia sp. alder85J]|uniref:WS/DGAT domain-containing protein n=1 Tax=Nocardia sp. alder85J TaxID=2862949 RepID=UPI001CD28B94|nr:WS/DGAT domain-containing protein [Nocardia sp. alder85J]MCX4093801.1 WS/DGAT domain-containing protein [Nocardia sp. alder85J]
MVPRDAISYWLSQRACNDLFLLYCFDDPGIGPDRLRAALTARCATIADLRIRLREYRFAYPRWVPCEIDADQLVEHELPESDWAAMVTALAAVLPDGVRADRRPWRLHLFPGVTGAPGGPGPALVVVLQLSHALADGRRAAEIARALFRAEPVRESPRAGDGEARRGRDRFADPDPGAAVVADRRAERSARAQPGPRRRSEAVRAWQHGVVPRAVDRLIEARALLAMPGDLGLTLIRGIAAERSRRELGELTARGEIPPPAGKFAPTTLNHPPVPGHRIVRMLVRDDLRAPGHTVTVLALTAISVALPAFLARRGEAPAALAAQVPVALTGSDRFGRNNYRDIAVELPCAEPDLRRRADLIAAELAARRERAGHPLLAAPDRVTAALPAPVLRRDIAAFPLDTVPAALSAHTVVSSVHRGPADLTCAGAPVRFTAGFPALGAVMHLTHGVHGLGGTVTVSLHADADVLPDLGDYADALDAALTRVVAATGAPR